MNVTDFVDTNILVYAYDLKSLGLVPRPNLLTGVMEVTHIRRLAFANIKVMWVITQKV
jgi:hypothetical protein